MIFDDYRAPRRALEEIESEADRCRSSAQLDEDGRIDIFELLKAWDIKLRIKSDAEMGDAEAHSLADTQEIRCRRSISCGLRFGDPHARYVIGHELGHMFLHRGSAPKARKVGGNRTLVFIAEDESAERQAWKFARALFVTRLDLASGESDEEVGVRVGLATGPVSLRREEVRMAMRANMPKSVPSEVTAFLERSRRAENEAESTRKKRAREDAEMRAAWTRAAQIEGENPASVRSARGFRVEWNDYGCPDSQVGWTIINGEVRSFMELRSR
jgi:hypothetical protein